nr:GNAT family N-acetyltransferase [Schumannella luteola]
MPPGRPDLIDESARVLAAAFERDPVVARIVPSSSSSSSSGSRNAADRRERIAAFFAWGMRSVDESGIDLAVEGDLDSDTIDSEIVGGAAIGRVLGVTLWEGPEHRPRPLGALHGLLAAWRAIGFRGLREDRAYEEASAPHRPTEPHWYLVDVGVHPDAAGRGIGAALLAHGLARADAAGLPAALTSTSAGSRRLYELQGFVTTHETTTGPFAGLTSMRRPPAAR